MTTTATKTVSAPPATLSYKPPLSPQVQSRVNDIVTGLINRHIGEATSYYVFNTYTRDCRDNEAHKVHIKNGVLTAIEPDDFYNPGMAREDGNWDNVLKGTLQMRSQQRFAAYRKMIYDPNRLIYPMKKTGTRADQNSPYVRISWDEALTTITNAMQNAINKYGPQSIYDVGVTPFFAPQWFNAGATGWSILTGQPMALKGQNKKAWRAGFLVHSDGGSSCTLLRPAPARRGQYPQCEEQRHRKEDWSEKREDEV